MEEVLSLKREKTQKEGEEAGVQRARQAPRVAQPECRTACAG